MNLKSMSLEKLSKLKDQVDAALVAKVADERHTLEARLGALSRINNGSARRGRAVMRGGAVAPKYRNPDNPGETWAGRGLKPRWLTAALKAGHKIEDFLIAAVQGKAPRGRKPAAAKAKAAKTAARRRAPKRKAQEETTTA